MKPSCVLSLLALAPRLGDYQPEREWRHADLTIWILAGVAAVLVLVALLVLLLRRDRSVDRAIAIR
ncbi:MAG: hypothetical protein ACYTGB_19830, partial [Planctomycetota bacterium]